MRRHSMLHLKVHLRFYSKKPLKFRKKCEEKYAFEVYDTTLYYTILYYTTLHWTMLYYTTLNYTILYYTMLGTKGHAMPAGS